MSSDEFVFLLLDNIPTYILALIISLLVLLPVIWKTYKGILDPLFYTLIMAVLANTVPFFLILTGKITISSLIYFLLTEVFFWIGFLCFNRKELRYRNSNILENERNDLVLFIVYFLLLITLKLSAYNLVGIPIFYEEGRLAVFTESGGLGILERLSTFPNFFISFYSFKLIEKGKGYKRLAIIALISVVVFGFLSGSKAAVLIVVGGYFYFNYFYKKNFITTKKILKYLPFLLVFPLLILNLQKTGTGFDPFVDLIFRFIANGDVYYMALPNEVINTIQINDKFTYFFSGILAPFRLIDINTVDTVIGYQLNWNLHPHIDGSLGGPNSRIPIVAWVFFEWGGIFFAFFLGLILSLIYNKLSLLFSKGIISYILIAYIQYNLLVFITDPVLGIGTLFDILINMLLFVILYFLINKEIAIVYEE